MSQHDAKMTARQQQLELLNAYLGHDYMQCPQSILIHGPSASGKSFVLQQFLTQSHCKYSIVSCQQCLTPRVLLQRALKSIKSQTGYVDESDELVAVENFGVFFSMVAKIFKSTNTARQPHFLVLDRIDEMPDVSFDLYSCFARTAEMSSIKNLTVVFVVTGSQPRALVTTTIPHIYFAPYTREEALAILCEDSSLCPYGDMSFREKFFSLVYDTLGSYTGTNIRRLSSACRRVWPIFTQPILDGSLKPTDFIKLYRRCEYLFSSEAAVSEDIVDETLESLAEMARTKSSHKLSSSPNLTRESNYILCAAYLASYNPPRFDSRFFSRAKEARGRRRVTSRRKQLKINPRSLAAPAFDLERMLAILQSIMSQDDDYETCVPSIDIGVQIATLTKLKLIVRSSSTDPLDSRTRWKINASWELVYQAAQEVDLNIEDYLME